MKLPDHVTLVEVGPRDGLQNESTLIRAEDKIHWIELLSQTGLRHIEATSFVSAHKIPQLADNQQVMRALLTKRNHVTFSALVPNLHGLHDALATGVSRIAVFGAVSETFSQRNINCSIADSMIRFAQVIKAAKQQGVTVRGYLSCVFGCPYEGNIRPAQVVKYVQQLFALGCDEIALGDTIGVATPRQVLTLLQWLTPHIPCKHLALHFHDTYGQALANIYAALQFGVTTFDCSASGLGGCPYARSATGNVATEEVVYLLNGLGIEHGVDLKKLVAASRWIDHLLQRTTQSRVVAAWEGV